MEKKCLNVPLQKKCHYSSVCENLRKICIENMQESSNENSKLLITQIICIKIVCYIEIVKE